MGCGRSGRALTLSSWLLDITFQRSSTTAGVFLRGHPDGRASAAWRASVLGAWQSESASDGVGSRDLHFNTVMSGAHVRMIAAVALAAHLVPLGLPALCPSFRSRPIADCGMSVGAPVRVPTVSAASDRMLCANPAFCAMAPTALPSVGQIRATEAIVHRVAEPGVVPAAPGEPPPPLTPPPQA
jgi:hypothetical protein